MWFRNQCSNSKQNGRGVKRDPSSGHRPRLLSSPCMWSAFCLGTKTISKELWLFFLKNKVSVKFDEVKDFVAALKNLLAIQGQEVRSEGNSLSRAVWPFPLTVYLCVLWFLSESGRLFCNHGNSLTSHRSPCCSSWDWCWHRRWEHLTSLLRESEHSQESPFIYTSQIWCKPRKRESGYYTGLGIPSKLWIHTNNYYTLTYVISLTVHMLFFQLNFKPCSKKAELCHFIFTPPGSLNNCRHPSAH